MIWEALRKARSWAWAHRRGLGVIAAAIVLFIVLAPIVLRLVHRPPAVITWIQSGAIEQWLARLFDDISLFGSQIRQQILKQHPRTASLIALCLVVACLIRFPRRRVAVLCILAGVGCVSAYHWLGLTDFIVLIRYCVLLTAASAAFWVAWRAFSGLNAIAEAKDKWAGRIWGKLLDRLKEALTFLAEDSNLLDEKERLQREERIFRDLAYAASVFLVLATLAALTLSLAIIPFIGDRDEAERWKFFAEMLKFAGTILLAGVGVLGVYYTHKRMMATDRQHVLESKKADDLQRATDEKHALEKRAQFSERFVKAMELLGKRGDENLDLRLGGIYALGALAKESPEDYPHVMQVLCTYVREHTRMSDRDWEAWEEEICRTGEPSSTPADIQAIMTVLGQRIRDTREKPDSNGFVLDLAGANLYQINLHSADLGKINLRSANLSWANISGANLQDANLSMTKLKGADLRWTKLEGADLNYANLQSTNLQCTIFPGVDLVGADLQGANLDLSNLSGSLHLIQDQVDATIHTIHTQFPSGIINRAVQAGLGPGVWWSREEYGIPGQDSPAQGDESP